MSKSTKKTDTDKSRLRCKESMRRLRDRIKNDPFKYEEAKRKERERYYARKAAGKIKGIKDMTTREQRQVRRVWRNKFRKRYERKKREQQFTAFLEKTTPPSTPTRERPHPEVNNLRNDLADVDTPLMLTASTSRQYLTGKKVQRRNRDALKNTIKSLEIKLKQLQKSVRKYKKRYYRLRNATSNETDNSPGKKEVEKLVKNLKVNKGVKKRLMFGEVITSQLKENFKKQRRFNEKRSFVEHISGGLIRRYGYTRYLCKIASNNILYRKTKKKMSIEKSLNAKELVKQFLIKDENSRLCPGKRDTITYRKLKKQKRYLNDTMKSLYKKFKYCNSSCHISYATFCKFRPFWVLQPNVRNRNTCMCVLHANMSLVVLKLHFLKIIKENTPEQLIDSLCCSRENESCLERECFKCKYRNLNVLPFDRNEWTSYEKWITKREIVIIKGKKKLCARTIKERISCKKGDLYKMILAMIPKFLIHFRNIYHQYAAIAAIKKNLSTDEILFHIDFSENYVCKYAEEIQSAHFGGSKAQVSLHTVIVYHRPSENSAVIPLSFCTLSDDLRHDPSAICAHMNLVIREIRKIIPIVTTAHFLSDGPSTQYRNKKMFFLMTVYLTKQLDVQNLRWHYSESGHGKGAPDGVGGYIKRQADRLVALGEDISSYQKMLSRLNDSAIKVIGLNREDINKIDMILPANIPTFKGTMKCHEICWSRLDSERIYLRILSCLKCNVNTICDHYHLGEISLNGHHGKK